MKQADRAKTLEKERAEAKKKENMLDIYFCGDEGGKKLLLLRRRGERNQKSLKTWQRVK